MSDQKPAPDTYELPTQMRRPDVRPAPPKKQVLATLPFKLMLSSFTCFFLAIPCFVLVFLGEGQMRGNAQSHPQ